MVLSRWSQKREAIYFYLVPSCGPIEEVKTIFVPSEYILSAFMIDTLLSNFGDVYFNCRLNTKEFPFSNCSCCLFDEFVSFVKKQRLY